MTDAEPHDADPRRLGVSLDRDPETGRWRGRAELGPDMLAFEGETAEAAVAAFAGAVREYLASRPESRETELEQNRR